MVQIRITAVLLFAALPAAAQGGVAFTNPVWRADAPDPTCWRADDGYYLTSTARALLKSTDLVHWQKVRDDFLAPGERARVKRDWRGIWAPDVARIGNVWNLYVSYWNGAENTAIAVYTSDRPASAPRGGPSPRSRRRARPCLSRDRPRPRDRWCRGCP